MFKRSLAAVLIAMCAAIGPGPVSAQEVKGPTYELKLRDGSRVYGAIERQTDEQIEFRTIAGALITAQAADVLALKEVKGTLVAGEFLPDDPNQTRLFFGPTARSLPKGAVSFGTYEFVYSGHAETVTLPCFIDGLRNVTIKTAFYEAAGEQLFRNLIAYGFASDKVVEGELAWWK